MIPVTQQNKPYAGLFCFDDLNNGKSDGGQQETGGPIIST